MSQLAKDWGLTDLVVDLISLQAAAIGVADSTACHPVSALLLRT
jgi:hypothetical protein